MSLMCSNTSCASKASGKRSSFSSSSRDTICAERIEGDLVLCTTGAGFINSEGGSITTLPGLPQLREPACVVT